jgi:RNA polymerase sigma-70 factor (sigma-E family)
VPDSSSDEYTEFVRARLPQWRRVAYLMSGDWDRGDDVLQRVLAELYEKWPRARRADNPDGLARVMLMRRLLDERRRGWARVRLSATLPERPVVDPDPLDRIAMTQALRELPARQRAVLVLRYLMDLDVAATAEAMGCSEGTVKSQASRGLANLRRVLAAPAHATDEPVR